jgi:hypothetical protein
MPRHAAFAPIGRGLQAEIETTFNNVALRYALRADDEG